MELTLNNTASNRGDSALRSVAALVTLAAVLASLATGCNGGLLGDDGGLLLGKDAERAMITAAADETLSMPVSLAAEGDYQVFDLGSAAAGDEWTFFVEAEARDARRLVLAVLDGDDTVLRRERLSSSAMVRHTVLQATDHLGVAVMSDANEPVSFELVAALVQGGSAPAPREQVVYLNFEGASSLSIHGMDPISFPAFDAAMLGDAYAGHTDLIQAEILRAMQESYAAYNVTIISSADESAPAGAHSTIHFGGGSGERLGLGDSVDCGNEDRNDDAIVYVNSFADYSVMELTPEEMGHMVGIVAAHELGHLFGLIHTEGADQLMSDTRSAWDLVGDASFVRAPLSENVFPIGLEDPHAKLVATVGLRTVAD